MSAIEKTETTPDVETMRVVALINRNLDAGPALNAIAHMSLGLANLIGEEGRQQLKFLDFVDQDGGVHPSISARSLVVLRGSSNDIRKLRRRACEESIPFVSFTTTMTGDTYVEQLERTAATAEDELEYSGVVVFGKREVLQPLTKRYSLWK